MPAVKRVLVKKPGWRFAEERDVCGECAKLVAELNGASPAPPPMKVLHVPHEPTRIDIVEELFHMPAVDPTSPSTKPNCLVPGCTGHQHSRGLCAKHYDVNRRTGELEAHALQAGRSGRRPKTTTTATVRAPPPRPRMGTPPSPKPPLPKSTTTATPAPPKVTPPAPSSARFVVRLGALVVECGEISDVVALHRALGAE